MPSRVPLSRWCLPHPHGIATIGQAHLLCLVRRIADRDRKAFADLCDLLSAPILRTVRSSVPDQEPAAAVVVGTLMEVWWMARFHAGPETDVHAWLGDIVGRRIRERAACAVPPAGSGIDQTAMPPWWTRLSDEHDRQTNRVLAAVLGSGRLSS